MISLLSIDGKIFFSIVTRRMTIYLLWSSYIDTSVQKGVIPRVPGCLEHTGVVTQLIEEAPGEQHMAPYPTNEWS